MIIGIFKDLTALIILLIFGFGYHYCDINDSTALMLLIPVLSTMISFIAFQIIPNHYHFEIGDDQSEWKLADPGEFETYMINMKYYRSAYFMPECRLISIILSIVFFFITLITQNILFSIIASAIPFTIFYITMDYCPGYRNGEFAEIYYMALEHVKNSQNYRSRIQAKINMDMMNIYGIICHFEPTVPIQNYRDCTMTIGTTEVTIRTKHRNGLSVNKENAIRFSLELTMDAAPEEVEKYDSIFKCISQMLKSENKQSNNKIRLLTSNYRDLRSKTDFSDDDVRNWGLNFEQFYDKYNSSYNWRVIYVMHNPSYIDRFMNKVDIIFSIIRQNPDYFIPA